MNSQLFIAFTKLRRVVYQALGFLDKRILKQTSLITVLSYHSVSEDDWRFSIDLKTMKKQINYLKKNYQFISLGTLENFIKGGVEINSPSIVLTFDDGYKDILRLKKFLNINNIKPVLFLISDTQNVNLAEVGKKNSYLNKKEIKSLISAGWEIGCHSGTHANLSQLSPTQLNKEIVLAKKDLEKSLNIDINYFAYPRGKYSKKVLECVKKAKYGLGLTMDDGFIKEKINPLTIPRVGIDRTHSFSEFKSAISPSTIRVRKLIKSTFIGRYL